MLLTVTDTIEELEQTRRSFAPYYYFTYCALKEDMLSQALKYEPTTVLLRVKSITKELRSDIEKLYEFFPSIQLIIVSNDTSHEIPCAIQVKASTKFFHILYHVLYYTPAVPASIFLKCNLRVCGLFFNTYYKQIRLFGFTCNTLSQTDGTLLRFLAEHHPSPVKAEKIAECFFGYGKTVSLNTVSAAVSRINKHCLCWYNTHDVVKYIPEKGYKIDF